MDEIAIKLTVKATATLDKAVAAELTREDMGEEEEKKALGVLLLDEGTES